MTVNWDWTRVVFDHVKIGVRDASASIAFYKTVLEPLGIPPLWERERGARGSKPDTETTRTGRRIHGAAVTNGFEAAVKCARSSLPYARCIRDWPN